MTEFEPLMKRHPNVYAGHYDTFLKINYHALHEKKRNPQVIKGIGRQGSLRIKLLI